MKNSHHFEDEDGNAHGGSDWGTGWCISWQNGPVGMVRNGALVQDVLDAAVNRLYHLQATPSANETFEEAIDLLEKTIKVLGDKADKAKP